MPRRSAGTPVHALLPLPRGGVDATPIVAPHNPIFVHVWSGFVTLIVAFRHDESLFPLQATPTPAGSTMAGRAGRRFVKWDICNPRFNKAGTSKIVGRRASDTVDAANEQDAGTLEPAAGSDVIATVRNAEPYT